MPTIYLVPPTSSSVACSMAHSYTLMAMVPSMIVLASANAVIATDRPSRGDTLAAQKSARTIRPHHVKCDARDVNLRSGGQR